MSGIDYKYSLETLIAPTSGVEVLEQASDLDAHVSSEAVVYLLVHSAPDDEILVSISSYHATCQLTEN